MADTQPIEKDQELLRIKSKIEWLNNIFKQGAISILIKLFISLAVTLEISNGDEKITIQEILQEFKNRIDELNKIFEEMSFGLESISDPETRSNEKAEFKKKVYKLFDLGDLVCIAVKKCVSFGRGIHKILPPIISLLNPHTEIMIDSILFTDSDSEFENKIYEYILDRVSSIEDPVDRKIARITMLSNLLKKTIDEPVDMNYYAVNNINTDNIIFKNKMNKINITDFVELSEKLHKKD